MTEKLLEEKLIVKGIISRANDLREPLLTLQRECVMTTH
jgi:hypothetical protein